MAVLGELGPDPVVCILLLLYLFRKRTAGNWWNGLLWTDIEGPLHSSYTQKSVLYQGVPSLSNEATERRLRLFGHIARSAPDEDHHRAVAAVIRKSPSDWKRPPGRPNHTWLRAIESDLRPLNRRVGSSLTLVRQIPSPLLPFLPHSPSLSLFLPFHPSSP